MSCKRPGDEAGQKHDQQAADYHRQHRDDQEDGDGPGGDVIRFLNALRLPVLGLGRHVQGYLPHLFEALILHGQGQFLGVIDFSLEDQGNFLVPGLAVGIDEILKFFQTFDKTWILDAEPGELLQDLIIGRGTFFDFVLYLLLFGFIVGRNHPQHVQPLPVHIGPEFDQIVHHFNFFF